MPRLFVDICALMLCHILVGGLQPVSAAEQTSDQHEDHLVSIEQRIEGFLQRASEALAEGRLSEAERLLRLARSAPLNETLARRVKQMLLLVSSMNDQQRSESSEQRAEQARKQLQSFVGRGGGRAFEKNDWPAYLELKRLYPQDPLLQAVRDRLRPDWAQAAGQDDNGIWAAVRIGRTLMRFRYIVAGSVTCDSETQPFVSRTVTVSTGFWMAEHECTVEQWTALAVDVQRARAIRYNEDAFKHAGLEHIVPYSYAQTRVGIADVEQAAAVVNERLPQVRVRLPTEREWEYAARAGETGLFTPWFQTRADATIDRTKPEPIALYQCNAWGLFDMHGGVWELCLETGQEPIRKGGGWRSRRAFCSFLSHARVIDRVHGDESTGFRFLIESKDQ